MRITEKQAQSLATVLGVYIASDDDGRTAFYVNKPTRIVGGWAVCQNDMRSPSKHGVLPLKVKSDRPSHELIWSPQ